MGKLPAELTSFIGRRRQISEIKRLLSMSRLVTLTGVGGAGKTRLSLQVANNLRRAFPDGVWFVELADLDDEALLAHTIANALGVHNRTTRWPTPALAEYVSDKRLLLVLDNCEHLRNGCAVLADAVLRVAPDVRILATSRQALGLTGEHIFNVPTMSVPPTDRMPPLAAAGQYEAVTLFLERATAAQPHFALTDANCEKVIRVCQQLDGIPLAIELTAVRLRALSIDDILARLQDRFHLLTAGSPAALPRHQTLRGLIDWSSDLCSERERTLWARLSVFHGGFDLPGAEAICTGGGIDPDDLVDLLATLVDKSIVIAEQHAGHVRYRLLETIKQYGLERLRANDEATELRRRHRDHFARVVERAWATWFGPDQEDWHARLLREHTNIRAALEFSFTEPDEADPGLGIAGALWFFWIATGLTSEGRRWIERGLARQSQPSPIRTRALWVCGYLCILQEDIAAAKLLTDEARRHADQLGDDSAAAWAVQLPGMISMSEGDLANARAELENGLRMHRARSNSTGILTDCFSLVAVTALAGQLHRAAAIAEQALAMCDSHGERWLKSYLLWDLGLVAWQLGDSKRAAAAARDGLQLARPFNEQWAIAFCIEILAWVANTALMHRRAAHLLGSADSIWRRIGAPLLGMRHLTNIRAQCVDQVRDRLGGTTFDAEFAHGSQMSVESAISYVLEEPEPTQHPNPADTPSMALTPRESEVADLIAEGLSNKAIATKLVIARRTAEAHVEHILDKLGFSSRAQVAAWVAEHRPENKRKALPT